MLGAFLLILLAGSVHADIASYSLTFTSYFTESNFPEGFPQGGGLTPPVACLHSGVRSLWNEGETASVGVQNVAEAGNRTIVETECTALSGDLHSFDGPGIKFEVDRYRPYLDVLSMIAPSPDWFVGIHSLSLIQNGEWRDEITAYLYAHDAGTDSGTTYTSPNDKTVPRSVITRKIDGPFSRTQIVGLISLSLISIDTHGQVPLSVNTTANYEVTFTGQWSPSRFPKNYPSNSHFSDPVGCSHALYQSLFRVGKAASLGVKNVAEMGDPSNAKKECVELGRHAFVAPNIIRPGNSHITWTVTVEKTAPFISLISMVAPSPDWFVGIDAYPLLDGNNRWKTSLSLPLYPLDAGTDSGSDFGSPNDPTVPPGIVSRLNEGPLPISNSEIATVSFKLISQIGSTSTA